MMGNLFPIIGNLVMNHILKELILESQINIHLFYRYVGNLILNVNERDIDTLLIHNTFEITDSPCWRTLLQHQPLAQWNLLHFCSQF